MGLNISQSSGHTASHPYPLFASKNQLGSSTHTLGAAEGVSEIKLGPSDGVCVGSTDGAIDGIYSPHTQHASCTVFPVISSLYR
jgi:hypothetical protein